jgi:two-component system, sensor histidine kinase SagS
LELKPTILCVGQLDDTQASIFDGIQQGCEVTHVRSVLQALACLSRRKFDGIFVSPDEIADSFELAKLLENERILDAIPDGLALLDRQKHILLANSELKKWAKTDNVVGKGIYEVLTGEEHCSEGFCPFEHAAVSGEGTIATINCSGGRILQVHVASVLDKDGGPTSLIATARDITASVQQRNKLDAIHRAGVELTDLTPEEIFEMSTDQRIDLLKSNILHFTKDLLKYDVVEIRLLDQNTGDLIPLLSEGIDSEAAKKPLIAKIEGNGVTGYVAATGKSYLCRDTTQDKLYIQGLMGARSSLTVPLVQHDQVIGTFNVESPKPDGFGLSDKQFLEIFSRHVAFALNTLELLVAQQANTAQASVEAIHGEVSLPVDEILNDAVNVMERYIGLDGETRDRLQRILRNARSIKESIHQVGEELTPAEAVPESRSRSHYAKLRGARILVADADEAVRSAAHELLERHGCIVETAHEGTEAIKMVRYMDADASYDVIIADVGLKNPSGYELFVQLKTMMHFVPMILMSGFGYDPGHTIVKARQAGLLPNMVLYKPFRNDQLLEIVSNMVAAKRARSVAQVST